MTRRELFKRLIYTPIVAIIAKPKKGIELFFGHLTYHDIPVVTDMSWDKNRLDYIAADAFYGGSAGGGKSLSNVIALEWEKAVEKSKDIFSTPL